MVEIFHIVLVIVLKQQWADCFLSFLTFSNQPFSNSNFTLSGAINQACSYILLLPLLPLLLWLLASAVQRFDYTLKTQTMRLD